MVCTNLTFFKLSLVFNTFVHFLNMWCVLLIKLYMVLMMNYVRIFSLNEDLKVR
jgi:hypothetical protein